jgi:hypothetical protein
MKILFTAIVLSSLAVTAYAGPLPTDTLANILAIPGATGTIAGTTFAFNDPKNGIPEYFGGPWANGSNWGTDNNIIFTPDATNADDPGFTLTGNFRSNFGQHNEIVLGFYNVTAPVGKKIIGVSVDMGTTVGFDSNDYVWNGIAFEDMTHSPTYSTYYYFTGFDSITDELDLRFWDTNPTIPGPVGFDSASIHYIETPLAPTSSVPEPASYTMLLAGLGLMGLMARRKHNA